MSRRETSTPHGCYTRAIFYGVMYIGQLIVGLHSDDEFTQNITCVLIVFWIGAALLAIRKGERLERDDEANT